jgi:hypothetical protein
MKKVMKKAKKALLTLVAVAIAIASTCTTAFAAEAVTIASVEGNDAYPYFTLSTGETGFCADPEKTHGVAGDKFVSAKNWVPTDSAMQQRLDAVYINAYTGADRKAMPIAIWYALTGDEKYSSMAAKYGLDASFNALLAAPAEGYQVMYMMYTPEKSEAQRVLTGVVKEIPTQDEEYVEYDINIDKKDKVSLESVPGAKFELSDEAGNIVAEWVSTDKPHTIEGLKPGVYVVTEIEAPAGYLPAEPMTIELLADGSSKTDYTVLEDFTKLIVKKVDQNGETVVGAKLQIIAEDGTVVADFLSEEIMKFERLPEGTYTLHEVEAPAGYKLADDVKFEINGSDEITVTMVDVKEDTPDTPDVPPVPQTGLGSILSLLGAAAVLFFFLVKVKKASSYR